MNTQAPECAASDGGAKRSFQDDGALEIFAYAPASENASGTLSLIATYENFSENPVAFKGVSIGGSFLAIGDLIV